MTPTMTREGMEMVASSGDAMLARRGESGNDRIEQIDLCIGIGNGQVVQHRLGPERSVGG